jgi:glycosyltransferase involved in cell wall biosynthesis
MPYDRHDPICTIIVPAFNEAAVIGGTLRHLLNGALPGEFDVIVVCNGCKDQTADMARAAAPADRVMELEAASKTAALNAGIAAAKTGPVVFLDADIKTAASSVRQLVHRLNWSDAFLAYGQACFNTNASGWAVRAFYRAWRQNPYFDNHKMGGFFAISTAGLRELGSLPQVTNDDEYVRRKLMKNSVWVEAAPYRIEAPRDLISLVRVRSRVYRGNRGLAARELNKPETAAHSTARLFASRLAKAPALWPGACVFAVVAVAAHVRNRMLAGTTTWEQDKSARSAGTAKA